MDDGRMQNEFAGIARAQLATDALLNLHRHTPESYELSSHFSEVASDVGLLHLSQGTFEIARFDEGRLGPLRNGLVQHKVADVSEQTFNEISLTVVDAEGFGDLTGEQGAGLS